MDSIINNYRAEFSDARTLSERQQRLYRFTRMLSNIAQTYRIAVVVTNQVNYSSQQDTASQLEKILWLIAVLIEFL